MTFWMGPQRVYLITGPKNVQAVIRNSGHLSSDELTLRVLPYLDSVTAKDLKLFTDDHSGRGHVASDATPEDERMWAPNHRVMVEHLSSTTGTETLMARFCELLSEKFEMRERGKWETLQLWQFVKTELVESAIVALAGKKLLEVNPGFVDVMWEYDGVVYPLMFGTPKLLYPKAYRIRDRYHDMGKRWLEYAFEHYDDADDDLEWEETFGTRFVRTHARFLKGKGLDQRSRSGMALGSIWAYVFLFPPQQPSQQ